MGSNPDDAGLKTRFFLLRISNPVALCTPAGWHLPMSRPGSNLLDVTRPLFSAFPGFQNLTPLRLHPRQRYRPRFFCAKICGFPARRRGGLACFQSLEIFSTATSNHWNLRTAAQKFCAQFRRGKRSEADHAMLKSFSMPWTSSTTRPGRIRTTRFISRPSSSELISCIFKPLARASESTSSAPFHSA